MGFVIVVIETLASGEMEYSVKQVNTGEHDHISDIWGSSREVGIINNSYTYKTCFF